MALIFSCIALAQNGCGKFQPMNAPTAIQINVSNMMLLLYSSGCEAIAGPVGFDDPNAGGGMLLNDDPDELGVPNAGGVLMNPPPAGVPKDELLLIFELLPKPPMFAPALSPSFSCVRP